MKRYHINPRNGNPGPCRAEKNCPFGDMETEHYSTKAAARDAYEHKQRIGGEAGQYLERSSAVASEVRAEAEKHAALIEAEGAGEEGIDTPLRVAAKDRLEVLREAAILLQAKDAFNKNVRGETLLPALRERFGVTTSMENVEVARVPDFSEQRPYGAGDDVVHRVVVHTSEGKLEFFHNLNSGVLHAPDGSVSA